MKKSRKDGKIAILQYLKKHKGTAITVKDLEEKSGASFSIGGYLKRLIKNYPTQFKFGSIDKKKTFEYSGNDIESVLTFTNDKPAYGSGLKPKASKKVKKELSVKAEGNLGLATASELAFEAEQDQKEALSEYAPKSSSHE